MEFRRIEYFLVLAEKLNYSQAASELCISPQALTKQINTLEEELGARLFERTTRHVQLTEDGLMCQTQFANLKAHYDATIQEVLNALSTKQPNIKIGVFAALPKNELLTPLINGISNQFPELNIEILTNNMDSLRNDLKQGSIDLAITNAHDFEDWIGCERINFKTLPAQIVVSRNHPWVLQGKTRITSEDMKRADILLLIKHGPYEFNSFYRKVESRKRDMVPDFDTMIMTLETGKHYAVFPKAFNDAERSKFAFFDLPDEYKFNFRTMCAFKTDSQKPEIKQVFNYIKVHKSDFQF